MVVALLMFCLVPAIAGCEQKRVAVAIKPPADKLACKAAGQRPIIPPEYVIDWSKVLTVPQAKSEHDKFVGVVRTREGIVAGYIIAVEDQLFACANNAQWLQDFFAKVN